MALGPTILFSIDGMRPDGLLQAKTPRIDDLIANGSSTMTAHTVMPCCTLPCHTSMLRGCDVARHGINTNTFHPIVRPVPSVFEVAKWGGKQSAFFYNWGPLRDLHDPESVRVSFFVSETGAPKGDRMVAESAIRLMKEEPVDFAFVYLGCTDQAGHDHGWMSAEYLDAISVADKCVAAIMDGVGARNALVMSDHGGHERTHGTEMSEDMTIPFVLWGEGVRRGLRIDRPVVIYDAAPTLMRLIGAPSWHEWEGRAVDEAFE